MLNFLGEEVDPGLADSKDIIEIVTSTNHLQLLKISHPDVGLWHLMVSTTSNFAMSVKATSIVDFSYRFVEEINIGLGGYRELDGKPLAGWLNKMTTLNFHYKK